jgi:hypothetical protein
LSWKPFPRCPISAVLLAACLGCPEPSLHGLLKIKELIINKRKQVPFLRTEGKSRILLNRKTYFFCIFTEIFVSSSTTLFTSAIAIVQPEESTSATACL